VPRSIDSSAELSLQGSLFGAPEPTVHAAKNKASTGDLLNLNGSDGNLSDLSDADLSDDALARPRRRREADGVAMPGADQTTVLMKPVDETNNSTTDEPAWAHHSQLQPEQLTPVLRHYVELKMAHPERVLLYRLGDFFECFFEDAITLSRELELTLTGKDAGKAIGRVPMAGIPHHAAERYCSDLIRLGYSVALCDQLETTPAKGALLKRDITRVLTPGTVLEEGMLSARRNNWLAAVVVEPANKHQPFRWGLAQADVSTGDVQVLQREGSDGLHQHLAQLQASELLWSGDDPAPAWCPDRIGLTPMSSTPFSRPEAEAALLSTTTWPASMAWACRNCRSPYRPSADCCDTSATPNPSRTTPGFPWTCPRSFTAATPRAGCPNAPQFGTHRHPAGWTYCRDRCSGRSIAPSPPWAAAACAAGSKPH